MHVMKTLSWKTKKKQNTFHSFIPDDVRDDFKVLDMHNPNVHGYTPPFSLARKQQLKFFSADFSKLGQSRESLCGLVLSG